MLRKRLVGVITVKDGWAVQSFGYNRYLPLGRPETLAWNLDRWGADEILVLAIDRSRRGLGPDLELLRRFGKAGVSTPVTYGGGVRTAEDAGQVIQSGAERLCVDAVLHDDPEAVRGMATLIGAQAVIAALPISVESGSARWHDYRTATSSDFPPAVRRLVSDGVISEALVIDWRHEGQPQAFDMNVVRAFPIAAVPLIAFGGVSDVEQLGALFGEQRVVAVGVGNALNYREHAIQTRKAGLAGLPVRPPVYA